MCLGIAMGGKIPPKEIVSESNKGSISENESMSEELTSCQEKQ